MRLWRRFTVRGALSFPVYRQHDAMDCGPACLRMIARHHGKGHSLQSLRERCLIGREGVSLLGISQAAESIGFRTVCARLSFEQLVDEAPLPVVAHWNQNHFVVVYGIGRGEVHVADPAEGRVTLPRAEFLRGWESVAEDGKEFGLVLLLEPTPAFYNAEEEEGARAASGLRFLLGYARQYRAFFAQVVLGMVMASVLQLLFPFFTQAIVDHGIANQDIGFVYVILAAQLVLFVSRTLVEYIRNRILFHLGARIQVSIISDFLHKLMRLPISFFDTRLIGDILQRVQDHARLQQFLTSTTLQVVFSAVTLVVFSVVLAIYHWAIFLIFAAGSAAYVGYLMLFLRRRKELDYIRFGELSKNHSTLIELVTGMTEIKLGNAEQQKRWGWERVQARLFRVNLRGMALDQYQEGGAAFINEAKNIAVTFLAAKLTIDGRLTLGMLLAVQYIIGQLNGPLLQLTGFLRSAQDARIALERLGEVHETEDEEEDPEGQITFLPQDRAISLQGVSFTYGGPFSRSVLRDLNLTIPSGKITAIVGASGSGKTTLLKLLLKFYPPSEGNIAVGGASLRNISARVWRSRCGVVMQDGHLFGDTIAGNIAIGDDRGDRRRLLHAVRVANIQDFVESLPIGYNTRVGRDGTGMSQGQKQRLLIARAVYKDPEYFFFDEATSALDANNERAIMENLGEVFRGRTVVVVAHRLSTVKHADQIVVLDRGQIVEQGAHAELVALRGMYYELVRNQLELGN